MKDRLRFPFQELLSRLRRPPRQKTPRPALRGRSQSVIVVKPRDPRFREAIFVLKEEVFSDPDCDREELLRQAREAARAEAGSVLPPGGHLPLWPAALLLLGAAVILKLTGVI